MEFVRNKGLFYFSVFQLSEQISEASKNLNYTYNLCITLCDLFLDKQQNKIFGYNYRKHTICLIVISLTMYLFYVPWTYQVADDL